MEGSVEKTWWNASNAAGAVVEGEKVWAANKQVRRKRNWTTGEQFFSWQFRWISPFLSQHLSPHQDAQSGNQVHNICTERGTWVIPLANSIDFCKNLFFCVVLKNTAKNRQSQISCKTGGCKFYRFIKRSLNQTLSPPPSFPQPERLAGCHAVITSANILNKRFPVPFVHQPACFTLQICCHWRPVITVSIWTLISAVSIGKSPLSPPSQAPPQGCRHSLAEAG